MRICFSTFLLACSWIFESLRKNAKSLSAGTNAQKSVDPLEILENEQTVKAKGSDPFSVEIGSGWKRCFQHASRYQDNPKMDNGPTFFMICRYMYGYVSIYIYIYCISTNNTT